MSERLAGVRWIARLDALLDPFPSRGDGECVAWIARHADAERWALPPAEAADLADAVAAKREGGGGRVLRRRLLRALAAHVLDVHPASVVFTRDARGAPGIAGSSAFISTAGCVVDGQGWSAVALAPWPIGVDLEPLTDASARWMLTEAYLKGLGLGLGVALETVRIDPDSSDGVWRLKRDGSRAAYGEVMRRPPVQAALAVWP